MEKRHIIFIHILIALAVALLIYVSTKPLLAIAENVLIIDAVVSGCILSVLYFFLKNIVRYGHFSSLIFRQRIINYSALGLLFVVFWIGTEYLVMYMTFPADDWYPLLPSLTIRIVIAVLAYCLIISIYSKPSDEDIEANETLGNDDSTADIEEIKPVEILERIVVKNGQKIDVIMISEIICIQAEGDYVMIHTEKGKFLKEQTMKSLENTLPSDQFVRVHRSSIINIKYIAQIELYNKQTQLLKLKNGTQVKVSLTGYRTLKNTLGL